MSPRFEPISGRYLHLELLGKPHRLYVEEYCVCTRPVPTRASSVA